MTKDKSVLESHWMHHSRPGILWGLLAAAAIALACLFPLSGDDWQWALYTHFSTVNGRYAGNQMARLLTQNLWLKPIIVGTVFTVIVYLSAVLGNMRKKPFLTVLLLAFLPLPVFAQVLPWNAGFANYTLPVLCLLVCACLLQRARRAPDAGWFILLGIFIAAGLAQLFVENITVAMMLFGFILWVYAIRVEASLRRPAFAAFAGFICGGAVMLSHPGYYTPVGGAHTMPGLDGMIANLPHNYLDIIVPHLIMNNLALNLFFCVLAGLLIVRSDWPRKGLDKGLIVFFGLMGAYLLLRTLHPAILRPLIAAKAEGVLAALYLLALCLAIRRHLPVGETKRRIRFLFLAIALLNGSLLVLAPIGPRCFFVSYVLFAVAAANLNSHLNRPLSAALGEKPTGLLVGALLFGLLITYGFIYGYTAFVVHGRGVQIEEQLAAGERHIVVRALPFPEYVWQGDPTYEYAAENFKAYYRIPAACTLEVKD